MKLNILLVFLAIFAVVVFAHPSSNDDFDEFVKRQKQPPKPTKTKDLKDPEFTTKAIPAAILLLIRQFGGAYVDRCRKSSCKAKGCPRVICTTLPKVSCCSFWCPVRFHKVGGKC